MNKQRKRIVGYWLLIGVVMVFFQVVIGGITRLTGSGLSITKWEIVTGTIPPTNAEAWESEFEKYQETPQYHKINAGMSLSEFKFIYFWEYFHRLWARLMGLVFAIPFLFFLIKRWLNSRQVLELIVVVVFAAIVASFGWIMVASGLEDIPWVSPFKLTLHLSLAILLFSYLWWLSLKYLRGNGAFFKRGTRLGIFAWIVTALLFLQIMVGGLMSGMKAGLIAPTWPDINGSYAPDQVALKNWNSETFAHYFEDPTGTAKLIVQFTHRNLAYLVFVLILILFYMLWKRRNENVFAFGTLFIPLLAVTQVILGIVTVLHCKGQIPVFWGVIHQAVAILLLLSLLWGNYHLAAYRKR
jgi:cytochrome c oxidase assembly protein subunit 15